MADGSLIFDTKVDTGGLKQGLSGVGKIAGGVTKVMATAFVATAAAATAGAAVVIASGKAYETSMAKVETMYGGVEVNIDNLDKKMLAMSSTTGSAATELGQAMYSALSAGIPVTEDMAEATAYLEKNIKLAKGGFTDVDTAVGATAKVLNAYGLDVAETDRIHGILMATQNKGITTVGELSQTLAQVTPVAAAMGVEFEYVGAALATMTAAGTPTAQATTQLKSMFAELGKSGTAAANGLAEAVVETKYAGMSFTEMMEAGLPLNEALEMMNTYAIANDKSLLDMFGSIEAGQAALALTGTGALKFAANIAAMGDTTGLVDNAFNVMMNTFEGQSDRFKESGKNLGISIYNGMKGGLTDIARLGGDYIEQLQKGFDEGGIDGLVASLGKVLSDAITKLAKKAPDMIKLVTGIIKSLAKSLSDRETINAIAEGLSEALEAAFELADAIPDLLEMGIKIAIALITSIAKKAPELVPKIIDAIVDGIVAIASNAPALLKAGLELAWGIVNGIIVSLPKIIGGVFDIFKSLFSDKLVIDEMFEEQFSATQSAYEAFKKAIADADANFDTTIADAEGKKKLAGELLDMYDAIMNKYEGGDLTEQDKSKLQAIVEQLIALYPELNDLVNQHTGLLDANTSAVRANIEAIAAEAIVQGYRDYLKELGSEVATATMAIQDGADALKEMQARKTEYLQNSGIDENWTVAGLFGHLENVAAYDAAIAAAEATLSSMQDALVEARQKLDDTATALVGLEPAAGVAADAVTTVSDAAEDSTSKIEEHEEALVGLNDELDAAGDSLTDTTSEATDTTNAVMEEAQAILDTTTALAEAQGIIDATSQSMETLMTTIETDVATALATMTGLGEAIVLQHEAVLLAIGTIFAEYEIVLAQSGATVSQAILDAINEILTEEAGSDIATLFLMAMQQAAVVNEPNVRLAFTNIASHTHSMLVSWSGAFYNAGSGWASNLASGIRSGSGAVAAAVQSLVASAIAAANRISSNYRGASLPGHRAGLEHVPVDNYPALLHKGEAVLTAAEAQVWRSMIMQSNPSVNLNVSDIISASRNPHTGEIHVVLKIGEAVIAEVFEPIISEAQHDRVSSKKG